MKPAATAIDLPLRDIHLPEPVSWWPIAPGWWLLLAAIVIACLVIWFIRRSWNKRRVLRQLKERLQTIRDDFAEGATAADTVRQLSVLLRRACITYFPRSDVASLTGDAWLQFLDSKSREKRFSEDIGSLLISAPYQPDSEIDKADIQTLFELIERELQHLHRQGRLH